MIAGILHGFGKHLHGKVGDDFVIASLKDDGGREARAKVMDRGSSDGIGTHTGI